MGKKRNLTERKKERNSLPSLGKNTRLFTKPKGNFRPMKRDSQREKQNSVSSKFHVEELSDEEETAIDSDHDEEVAVDRKLGDVTKYAFKTGQRILLVGEGDFSFSLSLVSALGDQSQMVATSFDSRETLVKKYFDCEAILVKLEQKGVILKFNVDATKLAQCLHVGKKQRRAGAMNVLERKFDRIVFNFPHIGLGIKNEGINIQKNRELIHGFLQSAEGLLSQGGQVVISLKTGMPYQKWNVVGIAHQTGIWKLARTIPFRPSDFPGYTHRRTIGYIQGLSAENNEEITGQSKVYLFNKE